MTWKGGGDYDDGSEDGQKFRVDHDGYLYDAEAEGDMENDSSSTNTDSEASLEDAPESAPAHARKRAPATTSPRRTPRSYIDSV